VRRTFTPGSEWLFFKLYGGAAALDDVLCNVIQPFARCAIERGTADRWFFIRYGDPDWHVRVRFHGAGAAAGGELFSRFMRALRPCTDDGRVRRIVVDTYEREVERYGGPAGIELAEELFQVDSETVIQLLDQLEPGDAGLDERWKLALLGLDRLLDDIGIDLRDRVPMLGLERDRWARQLRLGPAMRRELGTRYRALRPQVEPLLDSAADDDHALAPGIELLHLRSERLRPVIAGLQALDRTGRLRPTLATMTPSLLHMHANRMFRIAPNEHEILLYDILARLYTSRLHRAAA
jgi:thiopeptide-type bacteriocin biosynthesis protein